MIFINITLIHYATDNKILVRPSSIPGCHSNKEEYE